MRFVFASLICFLSITQVWAQDAQSNAAKTSALEIVLKEENAPRAVLDAIEIAAKWKLFSAYSFKAESNQNSFSWFVLLSRHELPQVGSRNQKEIWLTKLILVQQKSTRAKQKTWHARQLVEVKNAVYPKKLFWLNCATKDGYLLETSLSEKVFYAFSKGFKKLIAIQKFEESSFGPNWNEFEVEGVDSRGFSQIRESFGMSQSEGGPLFSPGNLWLWNGNGWSEQKTNTPQ